MNGAPSPKVNATPRRTQQQRRAETERRVLAATQRILLDHGTAAVTLSAVGEAAGYSRGIVNHTFGTRHVLIQTLAEQLQRNLALEVQDTTDNDLTGYARVMRWVEGYLSAFQHRTDDARAFLMLWTQAATSDPDLRPIFAERDTAFREALAHDLATGIADGSIHADGEPVGMAVALIGQLRGTGIQLLLAHEPTSIDTVHTAVIRAIARSLCC